MQRKRETGNNDVEKVENITNHNETREKKQHQQSHNRDFKY